MLYAQLVKKGKEGGPRAASRSLSSQASQASSFKRGRVAPRVLFVCVDHKRGQRLIERLAAS